MKLLIVTQKIDRADDNLGFFHEWVREFARHASTVVVIAGEVGEYDLPSHARVYSLGKENGTGRLKKLWRFWTLFSFYYARSDAVFFHMIPEYVLAAAPFLVARKKMTALWYVHKSVTWKLRMAERLVYYIFTASLRSFRLPSKKVIHTGHAIDTDFFSPVLNAHAKSISAVRLLALGRISPVKDYETVIKACVILNAREKFPWMLSIVGGPLMKRDRPYVERLKTLVENTGLSSHIIFEGAHPYDAMAEIYREHDILISMSNTGSVDKAILEAMACGLTVVTSNDAFQDMLPAQYVLDHRKAEFLASRIAKLAYEPRPNIALRDIVVRAHGMERTIKKIIDVLNPPSFRPPSQVIY